MKRRTALLPALATMAVAGLALTACGGAAAPSGSASANYVSGGTAKLAVSADPGDLNPLAANATSANYAVWGLAYDHLVTASTSSDKMLPNLAESWKATPTRADFVLRDGVTCSDGGKLTASDVAANFSWVLDKKNASPWFGAYVPPGSTVTADDAKRTVSIVAPTPSSFLLQNLSSMPIVCGAGLKDLSLTSKKTYGTGMYQLDQSTAGQSYTFTLRKDYAWGPGTITAKDPGVPSSVVIDVVPNESTQANMLLSGDLNIAQIGGADRDRLDKQGYFTLDYASDPGLMFFNQAEGRPGADPAVRTALVQAMDRAGIGKIATGGRGGPLKTFVTGSPVLCAPSAPIGDAAPAFDAKAAAAALDKAGWKAGSDGIRTKDGKRLTINILYPTTRGPALTSAVEAVQEAWAKVGVDVKLTGSDAYAGVLFKGGDWDAVWGPFSVSDPGTWQILLGGPTPPAGRNFSSAHNTDYLDLVKQAEGKAGADSCPTWLKAEQSLAKNVDFVPIMQNTRTSYGNKARFEMTNPGSILGPTIRLTK